MIDRVVRAASAREWRTPFAIALLAVLLYAPLIGWGVPHATGPDRIKTTATDEILPLEGLAEMRSTFISPAPDRNLAYPWLHYFVVASAQAPYLGWLLATGGMSAPDAAYPFGLADPVRALAVLTVLGRIMSVLMGAGVVFAVYCFTASLFSRQAAVVASLLAAFSYPLTYYSRTGNLDTPAFFWSAAGLAVFADTFSKGLTVGRAVWLGIFAACAVATKDQTVILFLPAIAALALPQWHRPALARYPAKALGVLVAVGLAAYAAATGMLVDPARHLAHMSALIFSPQTVTVSYAYMPPAPRTAAGAWTLVVGMTEALMAMLSPPVLLAGAAGYVLAVARDRRHLIWLAPLGLHFFLLVWGTGVVEQRYVLPFTLLVDACAAWLLLSVSARHRVAGTALVVFCLGWRVAVAADMNYAQWNDTRGPAGAWLRQAYQDGDRIEYFGVTETLPPLDAAMQSRRIMGRTRWAGTSGHGPAVLEYLQREGPRFVVIVPDWTSGRTLERSGDCPPEVYDALLNGSAGYRLAAHFTTPALLPAALARPPLDYWTVAPPVRIFVRADDSRAVR